MGQSARYDHYTFLRQPALQRDGDQEAQSMGLTGMGILSERGWQSRIVVDIRETALLSEKGGHQGPKAGATPAPPRTMAAGFSPFFPLHAVVLRI